MVARPVNRAWHQCCHKAVAWAENTADRYTHTSEGLERAGLLILQRGLVLVAAPPVHFKSPDAWGLRVDIKAAFLPCSPC